MITHGILSCIDAQIKLQKELINLTLNVEVKK